jgi:NADP-reducing hydrogenase subunit HndA
MLNPKTKVPFKGTKEQEESLRSYIGNVKTERGCLMPVLQKAQEIYGYLPYEVQAVIATELDIPMEEVYSTATFYAQFTLNPKGENQVSICLGTACYVKGAGDIMDRLVQTLGINDGGITEDGKFSLDSCRCVGACGLAPVVLVNDDVYGRCTPADVEKILSNYGFGA